MRNLCFMESHENKQDMNMEDILASIRRYVSDGQTLPKESLEAFNKQKSTVIELTDEILPIDLAEIKQQDFINFKKDAAVENAIFASQNMQNNQAQQEFLYSRQQLVNDAKARPTGYNTHDHHPMFPNPTPAPTMRATPQNINPFEKLQSEIKVTESNNSQLHLSANDLLAQMATPFIKSWLDQNLRKIVEEAVEREVQRIRKGM